MTDDINTKPPTTTWGALRLATAVAITAAAATWALCRAFQSDELEGYRKAKELNFKTAIEEITKLSKQAELDAKERTELLRLRTDAASYETQISTLTNQVNSLEKQNADLGTTLNSLVKESNSIEVPTGEARFVVPNTLAIGVANTYTSFADVRIGTANTTLRPGETYTVNLGPNTYVVTLLKISANSCTFAFANATKTPASTSAPH